MDVTSDSIFFPVKSFFQETDSRVGNHPMKKLEMLLVSLLAVNHGFCQSI